MKTQKKIAMSAGGAVLAACLTLGGLAAANAATPASSTTAPTSTTAPAVTTASVAAKQAAAAATTPVPPLPDHPYRWDEFIATLTPAQQKALLGDQQARLAKAIASGYNDAAIQKFTYNVAALKQALGEQ
ncbi:hypothetical protein GCM10022286_09700 [Gryllotalpicola daejeonensis]|uniref:Uncharacterized protein n=1 Tax=Gryllotalpicola daejeonensis TaxID=993087 RepID=A0ABP7ZHI1_9MICO